MAELAPLCRDVWTAGVSHRYGVFDFGARMTAVRLPSGELWLHSPVPAEPELVRQVQALGRVGYVIAPNRMHHLYAGDWARAFPDAALQGAPGLARKRTDLRFARELASDEASGYADALDEYPLDGVPALCETVFHHRPSGTLIACDLIGHLPHSLYGYLAGIRREPGMSRVLRLAFRDRAAARASVDRLLGLDFERIVFAHGEPVTRDARETLRRAYTWL